MNFLKFAFLLIIAFTIQVTAHAQEWVSYQSQQQINDLVDTGDKLLLATDAGLVVMNKLTLEKTVYNKANSSLSNNHIQTITQVDGVTWIGTYDALVMRFDGTNFQDLMVPQSDAYNPNTTELYDLKIAPNGDIWLGTTDGVFHKQGSNWNHYDEDEMGPDFFEAWDIEINEAGEVFIASNMIYKYVNGVWSNISDTTQLLGYLGADLFFSQSGDLYFAGDLDRIGRFDGEQWQQYEFEIDLNGSEVVRFTEDVEGNVYFNTLRDGIFKLEGNAWLQQMDAQIAAFNNETAFFYIDKQNNRWLNNQIYLSVNKNGNIQNTTIAETTLESNGISKLHYANNGHLYFVMTTGLIAVLDPDGNWSTLPLPSSAMPFEYYNDLFWNSENDIWLASNNGLYHYDGNDWVAQQTEACYSFAVDSQGKIYARAFSKIYILDQEIIGEYNVDNSPLPNSWISGHGIDANDNLWISSSEENSIQKLSSDGTWTTYTAAEHPAIDKPVGDFHFDVNGNVWVAADVVGAIQFDGETFSNPFIGNLGQIENYSVLSIESDDNGKLYFSHHYGVTTWLDGEWENLIIEEVPVTVSVITSNITFDDEGTLWWGSKGFGIFTYSPETTTSVSPDIKSNTQLSIYPNPAKEETNLDFTIEEQSTVIAFLYNQLGQLQSTIDLGQLPPGDFRQTLNLVNYPKGFYTLQLQINDQIATQTVIIQ